MRAWARVAAAVQAAGRDRVEARRRRVLWQAARRAAKQAVLWQTVGRGVARMRAAWQVHQVSVGMAMGGILAGLHRDAAEARRGAGVMWAALLGSAQAWARLEARMSMVAMVTRAGQLQRAAAVQHEYFGAGGRVWLAILCRLRGRARLEGRMRLVALVARAGQIRRAAAVQRQHFVPREAEGQAVEGTAGATLGARGGPVWVPQWLQERAGVAQLLADGQKLRQKCATRAGGVEERGWQGKWRKMFQMLAGVATVAEMVEIGLEVAARAVETSGEETDDEEGNDQNSGHGGGENEGWGTGGWEGGAGGLRAGRCATR